MVVGKIKHENSITEVTFKALNQNLKTLLVKLKLSEWTIAFNNVSASRRKSHSTAAAE